MAKNLVNNLIASVCDILEDNLLGYTEEIHNLNGFIIPEDSDYILVEGEEEEDYDIEAIAKRNNHKVYVYRDPFTNEVFLFDRQGIHKKNNRLLVYVASASEYQGRKVKLNKPFRTPGGPKKFSVYVKNDKGNVVKVNFGDPNMKIKKNIPERRKSFRARHNCDNPGPKWKARYWSCKAW
jgi:hypothetical protein